MLRLFDHPYAEFLPQVAKPNRYTGSEYGLVHKDWDRAEARVCLAFPDLYDIGMSHLGLRILYSILGDDPRLLAERCYTPGLDMQAELVARNLPLVSLESARPLRDFDVVGFSLQFELTYTNLLVMLDLSRIPRHSAEREASCPLILVGGPAATHVEPLANFIDAALIGDGEEALPEIALLWAELSRSGVPRRERLERLARVAGVYVPSLYDTEIDPVSGLEVVNRPQAEELPFPIGRRLVTDLSRYPFPATGPVGGPETVFERMSVEIARGCTEGCRFCQAGMLYRPVRERDPREVVNTVLRAVTESGQDEVGLTALSTADVSYITPLVLHLAELMARRNVSLGVASLRAYGVRDELFAELRRVRRSGLTFAPEAGTQRLRDVINKNVTQAQLLETAERAFSRGFDRLKLYFILGLPTEEDEDLDAIIELGRQVLELGRGRSRRPQVTVSVSNHVPKPHTPFQWCGMDALVDVRRKQARLRQLARGLRGLTLKTHHAEPSFVEAVLARGGRRLGSVIARVVDLGGRFDSWEDHFRFDHWQTALEESGIDLDPLLREQPEHARLPWDHLAVGIDRQFVWQEYRRALATRPSPPCSKPLGQLLHHDRSDAAAADTRELVCYRCGAECDLAAMRTDRLARLKWLEALDVAEPSGIPLESLPQTPGVDATARVRLRFAKIGPAALLGHLDLIRELGRLFRRAGLVVTYTGGFHPKPNFSFGPALALGIASLGELLEVWLVTPPPERELVERLNQVTIPGLEFVEARRLPREAPSLGAAVTGGDYVVAFAAEEVQALGGRDWLRGCAEALLAGKRPPVDRRTKRGERRLDPHAYVGRAVVAEAESEQLARRAGVVGAMEVVRAELMFVDGLALRPREFQAALTGLDLAHQCVRVRLLLAEDAATN